MRARGAGSIVGRFPTPGAGAYHIGQNGEFIVVEDGRINKKLAKRSDRPGRGDSQLLESAQDLYVWHACRQTLAQARVKHAGADNV